MTPSDLPAPGSAEERAAFLRLQEQLPRLYREVFPHPNAPRTLVVVPSLSLDPEELAKITGVHHYEERMLCMLLLLRLPRTEMIYLTSTPLAPIVIDYYLHLLPGIPTSHARRRLHLLSCHDASPQRSLSQKLLDRPLLLERVRDAIRYPDAAHMICFNASELEQSLAVQLGIPLNACDPELAHLGNKSGSRRIFREAGVDLPPGVEDLQDDAQLFEGLSELLRREPRLRRVVVKLNEGFSGEGNAVLDVADAPRDAGAQAWVARELPRRLKFEAQGETWEHFREKFNQMAGVVEGWVDGVGKRSPSVQLRIDPLGQPELVSTHDQVLGGPSGQIFLGATFPADDAYRAQIQEAGLRIAQVTADEGGLGRLGVDFVSVLEPTGQWKHYALEINLRKGGTTHPFMMLQLLTDGAFDPQSGLYLTPSGRPRSYYASDNLQSELLRGLTPEDLIELAVLQRLHFHGATQTGVAFHLIGALSEFGKLGLVCIAEEPEQALELYQRSTRILLEGVREETLNT